MEQSGGGPPKIRTYTQAELYNVNVATTSAIRPTRAEVEYVCPLLYVWGTGVRMLLIVTGSGCRESAHVARWGGDGIGMQVMQASCLGNDGDGG